MKRIKCIKNIFRFFCQDSQLLYEVDTPGPVSSITLSHGDGGKSIVLTFELHIQGDTIN